MLLYVHSQKKRKCKQQLMKLTIENKTMTVSSDEYDIEIQNESNDSSSGDSRDHDDILISSGDDYKPTKNEMNSSDSNSDLVWENISDSESGIIKKVKLKNIRDKSWKKKRTPKKCRTNSKAKTLETDHVKNVDHLEEEKALLKSKKEEMRRNRIDRIHKKRIDALLKSNGLALLKSNGLKRERVPADGNCFFEAIIKQLKISDTVDNTRRKLCDHMLKSVNHYLGFVQSASETLQSQMESFQNDINLLSQSGQWLAGLADVLPLVVCNMYETNLTIYSSSAVQPTMRITPSLMSDAIEKEIKLVYLAIPDREHYDSVKEIQVVPSGNITPNDSEENEQQCIITPEKQTQRKQCDITITPRKQAKYVSPPKKSVTRKRKANPDKWQKNLRKRLRQAGCEYTDTKGKTVQARKLKDINKCRFECSINVDEENRERIFQEYWGLNSYDRQRDYVCSQAESNAKGGEKRMREVTRRYKFAVDGKSVCVCKKFCIATLGIGIKTGLCVKEEGGV